MRSSCLDASEARSGRSIPQKIIDVVFPFIIAYEIHQPTGAPGLEEALSIPLLEGNEEACVPTKAPLRDKERARARERERERRRESERKRERELKVMRCDR